MLLTLSPSLATAKPEFRYAHESSAATSPTARLFIKREGEAGASASSIVPVRMSTHHRGLPPPSAIALGESARGSTSSIPSFSGMPEPPMFSHTESMRSWLSTKAEEERRKQEEEKTRQESLKLEQRRIEQNMLGEALRSGVPPQLVPLIFAGLGGAAVANLSIEWLQQYNNSLHATQQQHYAGPSQAAASPDVRRPPPGTVYPTPVQAPTPAGPLTGQSALPQYSYRSRPSSPSLATQQAPGHSGSSRAPLVPRLATVEQQPVAPPPLSAGPPTGGAVQPPPVHTGGQQENPQTSPSIYFHHWVPPSSAGGSSSAPPSEHIHSPRRRRGTGTQPSMAPTSEPRYTSTSFVHVSSPASITPGGRKRRLSDTSTSNRSAYTSAGGHKSRSRTNTVGSAGMPDDDRLRFRAHYQVATHDEHPDTNGVYGRHDETKHPRRSYEQYGEERPRSPNRREYPSTTLPGGKSSYGPAG